MAHTTFTPLELRSDPEAAKKAAKEGPVIITEAGKSAHELDWIVGKLTERLIPAAPGADQRSGTCWPQASAPLKR